MLQLFKRPNLHRLHAYLHTVEQVFQLLCYISIVKHSIFSMELNLHYSANNEGGGHLFFLSIVAYMLCIMI